MEHVVGVGHVPVDPVGRAAVLLLDHDPIQQRPALAAVLGRVLPAVQAGVDPRLLDGVDRLLRGGGRRGARPPARVGSRPRRRSASPLLQLAWSRAAARAAGCCARPSGPGSRCRRVAVMSFCSGPPDVAARPRGSRATRRQRGGSRSRRATARGPRQPAAPPTRSGGAPQSRRSPAQPGATASCCRAGRGPRRVRARPRSPPRVGRPPARSAAIAARQVPFRLRGKRQPCSLAAARMAGTIAACCI